jgi:hypothetical protein
MILLLVVIALVLHLAVPVTLVQFSANMSNLGPDLPVPADVPRQQAACRRRLKTEQVPTDENWPPLTILEGDQCGGLGGDPTAAPG